MLKKASLKSRVRVESESDLALDEKMLDDNSVIDGWMRGGERLSDIADDLSLTRGRYILSGDAFENNHFGE